MEPTEFDPKVCERIGHYVYALRDPRTRSIFYVGKGVRNRCFAHIEEARTSVRNTEKLDTIREILDAGLGVHIDIVRHGLDETTALEVEAALIDTLELVETGNEVRGHGADRGLLQAKELQIQYGATELIPRDPLLLIKINQQYRQGMTIDEVYKVTRWHWRLNISRARKAKYVLAVA